MLEWTGFSCVGMGACCKFCAAGARPELQADLIQFFAHIAAAAVEMTPVVSITLISSDWPSNQT
jgi:hypothetical protein